MELTKNYKLTSVILPEMKAIKAQIGDTITVSSIKSTRGDQINIEEFVKCCVPFYTDTELLVKGLQDEIAALKDQLKTRTKLRKPNKMLNGGEKIALDECIANGMTNPEIAEKFGVSQSMVSRRRPKAEENNNESATDYVQGLGN